MSLIQDRLPVRAQALGNAGINLVELSGVYHASWNLGRKGLGPRDWVEFTFLRSVME